MSITTLPNHPAIHIRKGVFETNSSSSHSLTLSEDCLQASAFSDEELESGKIILELGGFGWQWDRYYKPANKAAYMIVDMLPDGYDNSFQDDGTDLREKVIQTAPKAANVIAAIEEHTGCQVLIRGGDCYIDHDSRGTSGSIPKDKESIQKFLFSNSYITLGNDNESPGWVETDLGTYETVEQHQANGYG